MRSVWYGVRENKIMLNIEECYLDLQNMSTDDLAELYTIVFDSMVSSKYLDSKNSYLNIILAIIKTSRQNALLALINSTNFKIREVVASIIDVQYLPQLSDDSSPIVRAIVANRIDLEHLPAMMNDKHWTVRENVAKRIDESYLPQLKDDNCEWIRAIVALRIDMEYIPEMLKDKGPGVRQYATTRVSKEEAVLIWATDEDVVVRNTALKRVMGKKFKFPTW
jgi:hypothetical protein